MIFITGASGFLGRRIVAGFLRSAQTVCCLSRNKKPSGDSIKWLQVDLETFPLSKNLLEDCSVIIHAAAAIKGSIKELDNLNYHATKELLRISQQNNVKKFVFISSTDAVVSDNAYAKSKRVAEEAVKNSGLKWLIIRPPVIFGTDDTKNFVLLENIIKKFPIIPLPHKGLFRWQPVFVNDLAEYIINCTINDDIYNKCLNVVGPQVLTFSQIVGQLEKHNKVKRLKIPLSVPLTNFLKNSLSTVLGPHRTDEIFSTFKDKIVPEEGYGENVKLSTTFNQIYG